MQDATQTATKNIKMKFILSFLIAGTIFSAHTYVKVTHTPNRIATEPASSALLGVSLLTAGVARRSCARK